MNPGDVLSSSLTFAQGGSSGSDLVVLSCPSYWIVHFLRVSIPSFWRQNFHWYSILLCTVLQLSEYFVVRHPTQFNLDN